ncbi:MAG: hypothetical protein IH969_09455 [Candidatus Krumholzibacteriota bacterium]|nr:hypothetical protein [Candidatus Krumholzibacteriota bacterium]
MFTLRWILVMLLALLLACGGKDQDTEPSQAQAPPPPGYEKTAPLFNNLGTYHRRVSTEVALAQKYFDQGLILSYGFNHAEAARSFREAQKLDPDCAMAYWGEALVLGPNINAPMEDESVPLAWAALQKALERIDKASARERAYIQALSKRYAANPVADRAELDIAYANAMRDVAGDHPDDPDAQALFAESLMNTTPWDYWQEDGEPKWVTIEILATLERVLGKNTDHPGANHFYIHAVEAQHPERGVAAADRLGSLVPGAGHLVHMPCHIYLRVGRYADASDANEMAIAADQDYITQCHAQGLYPLAYMPHNRHFLWYTAAMEGRSERSITAAKHVSDHVDQEMMRQTGYGTLQHFYALPMYALARFGRWNELLAVPQPDIDLKYPNGVWYFTRGMALLRKGNPGAATAALGELDSLAADTALDSVTIWDINTTRHLLQIASEVLAGEIAATYGNYRSAVAHLQAAVDLEQELRYDEPAPWYAPVRQTLGAVLLEAGRPREAEQVYRAELETYPANGWSLFGLSKALLIRGKRTDAAETARTFEEAWSRADVTLNSSRF